MKEGEKGGKEGKGRIGKVKLGEGDRERGKWTYWRGIIRRRREGRREKEVLENLNKAKERKKEGKKRGIMERYNKVEGKRGKGKMTKGKGRKKGGKRRYRKR